jgi:hypothetical protein
VLVKVFELIVDDVEVFGTEIAALRAFKTWTNGLTPSQLEKREEKNPEEKYSQTKIFEIELNTMGGIRQVRIRER